jgi:hypothetical protein
MKRNEPPKWYVVFAKNGTEVCTGCTPTQVSKDLPTVMKYLDYEGVKDSPIYTIGLDDEDGTPKRTYIVTTRPGWAKDGSDKWRPFKPKQRGGF